jgi:hypothetical protein
VLYLEKDHLKLFPVSGGSAFVSERATAAKAMRRTDAIANRTLATIFHAKLIQTVDTATHPDPHAKIPAGMHMVSFLTVCGG